MYEDIVKANTFYLIFAVQASNFCYSFYKCFGHIQ